MDENKVLEVLFKVLTSVEEVKAEQARQGEILAGHTEMLTRHGEILAGHTEMLTRHGEILAGHTEMLTRHGEILARHTEMLTRQEDVLAGHEELLIRQSQSLERVAVEVGKLTARVDGLEEDVKFIKEAVIRIENDHSVKIKALFNGHLQNRERLDKHERILAMLMDKPL